MEKFDYAGYLDDSICRSVNRFERAVDLFIAEIEGNMTTAKIKIEYEQILKEHEMEMEYFTKMKNMRKNQKRVKFKYFQRLFKSWTSLITKATLKKP